jgi:hypothetical protein
MPSLGEADGRIGLDGCASRGLTRGGYLEQVRGYCRQPVHHA